MNNNQIQIDKVDNLIRVLTLKNEIKKSLDNKIEYIDFLQSSCDSIDKQVSDFIIYVESEPKQIPLNQFERILKKYETLGRLLKTFETQLIENNTELRNYELLEFYEDFDNDLKSQNKEINNPSIEQIKITYELIKSFKNEDSNKNVHSLSSETTKGKKTSLKLNDFIISIEDKNGFLEELKKSLKTEIGIELRAVIEVLKSHEVLLIGNRKFKPFLELLEEYFKRDIGTYQSINDPKPHQINTDLYNQKLISLISKYKQQE